MTQFDEKCKNCGRENIDHFVDNEELHCYIGSNYPRFEVDPTPTPSGEAGCPTCGVTSFQAIRWCICGAMPLPHTPDFTTHCTPCPDPWHDVKAEPAQPADCKHLNYHYVDDDDYRCDDCGATFPGWDLESNEERK